jgi:thioredoxin reductase
MENIGKAEEIAIIGGGPSGIAAAIQLKRFGLNASIFEKDKIGGLLNNANLVENYPGIPDPVSGQNLVSHFRANLEKSHPNLCNEEVICLDYDGEKLILGTETRTIYPIFAVIASGTRPIMNKSIQIPLAVKDKVHYEVYPVFGANGKRIAIVGAGDAAFDYALNLSRHNQVIILNRGETVTCLGLLRQRAESSNQISYFENTDILRVSETASGQICLECSSPENKSSIMIPIRRIVDYLLFAIGREPQLDFLSNRFRLAMNKLEEDGIIYFTGDVQNGAYRQVAIAVGDGVMAAMKIHAKLNAINNLDIK